MNESNEPYLSDKTVALIKRTLLSGYSEDEQESFIALCQNNRLDPLIKQIYATRRMVKNRNGDKVPTLVPVISAMGLTAIAVRTSHYDGCVITWAGADGVWREEWLGDEYPKAAKCVVYHKQRSHPEVGIARWESYVGRAFNKATNRWEVTDFWERMPEFMLAKCAKAQALRGAFPDQCNFYISEELQGGISEADQIDDEAKITSNRAKEEELLKTFAQSKKARIVESKGTRPTPAEAAEPAEPEPPAPVATAPSPAQPLKDLREKLGQPELPDDQPDDLDMGDAPETPAESPKAWMFHEIRGLKNEKFFGRTVGDLKPNELEAIRESWMTKVRAVWAQGKDVNSLQRADYEAFEAALAYNEGNVLDKPF
jgi:phage recombination protein Bet